MKKLFLILISIFALFTSLMAKDKALRSKDWVLFFKQIGQEKLILKFPKEPQMRVDEEGRVTLFSSADEQTYSLISMPLKKFFASKTQILQSYLAHVKNSTYVEVLSFSNKEGKSLSITYKDPWISGEGVAMICNAYMYLSDENVYALFAVSKEDSQNQHEAFFSSFCLES